MSMFLRDAVDSCGTGSAVSRITFSRYYWTYSKASAYTR